jgi:hypothetical protein
VKEWKKAHPEAVRASAQRSYDRDPERRLGATKRYNQRRIAALAILKAAGLSIEGVTK